jgi:hypothetical protein
MRAVPACSSSRSKLDRSDISEQKLSILSLEGEFKTPGSASPLIVIPVTVTHFPLLITFQELEGDSWLGNIALSITPAKHLPVPMSLSRSLRHHLGGSPARGDQHHNPPAPFTIRSGDLISSSDCAGR